MPKFGLFTLIALAMVIAAGCGAQREVSLPTEEAAIRRTDADWLAAASSHDLERVLPVFGRTMQPFLLRACPRSSARTRS